MNICLFEKSELGKAIPIKDDRVQHIIKVLKKNEGDDFFAGVIGEKSGRARITKIENDNFFFEFEDFSKEDLRPLFPLKMIVGFPRPIQLKRLLRDVAALGLCEIHLTGTELGEKSYLNSNLSQKENVYKMLLEGTVQAGATKIPEIYIHKNLAECLEMKSLYSSFKEGKQGFPNERSFGNIAKISLDNKEPKCSLEEVMKNLIPNKDQMVVAAIGSERGWTDRERILFKKNGYTICGMGNRIMRTETAATVAAAIILNYLGALK